MTADRQKRSSDHGMEARGCGSGPAQGAGGRLGPGCPGSGGGGYLDICTTDRLRVRDPRLAELREIGLGRHWLRVAAQIGVDAFLATWQILSQDDSVQDDCGRVHIPSITTYMRYQRNQVIATLAADGSTAGEIRRALKSRLGYDLTEGHIRKLMRERKE